ncbi:MAG: NADH-quinone oxidoreductase subunit H [Candidatus Omnitrophica bacterium]|nr:NADH-quinone oxidoreductase subunit H [Candidatus Omnitrophota bacterium]
MIKGIFYFLIFPGFLFTAAMGCLSGWFDRKLTARIHWRVGPPWYQNFVDFLKLLGKEIIVPADSMRGLFLFAPVTAVIGATLLSVVLWQPNLRTDSGFLGDLIVAIYLSMIPALALIIGGMASRNPLASLGASREMKLMLAYELPFIVSIATVIIKNGYTIRLYEMVQHQAAHGAIIGSPSGFIAFIVALLCMQAKLGLVPFDIAEAETEIMGGPLVEYSGAPLGFFRLSKLMMLFAMPVFLITVFWGGIAPGALGAAVGLGKLLVILLVAVLIKNTNPRLRIDQALRFFWGPVTVLAVISILLTLAGL